MSSISVGSIVTNVSRSGRVVYGIQGIPPYYRELPSRRMLRRHRCRKAGATARTIEETGGRSSSGRLDVTSEDSWRGAFEQVTDRFGRLKSDPASESPAGAASPASCFRRACIILFTRLDVSLPEDRIRRAMTGPL